MLADTRGPDVLLLTHWGGFNTNFNLVCPAFCCYSTVSIYYVIVICLMELQPGTLGTRESVTCCLVGQCPQVPLIGGGS